MTPRSTVAFLLAVVTVAGVAACGAAAPGPSGTEPPAGTPAPTPTGTPAATPTPPLTVDPTVPPRVRSPRPGKPSATGEIVITGHVTDGVEAGCRIIRTLAGPTYSLLLTPDLQRQIERATDPVTLRGRLRPGLMTSCQQGTPFEVTAVVPA